MAPGGDRADRDHAAIAGLGRALRVPGRDRPRAALRAPADPRRHRGRAAYGGPLRRGARGGVVLPVAAYRQPDRLRPRARALRPYPTPAADLSAALARGGAPGAGGRGRGRVGLPVRHDHVRGARSAVRLRLPRDPLLAQPDADAGDPGPAADPGAPVPGLWADPAPPPPGPVPRRVRAIGATGREPWRGGHDQGAGRRGADARADDGRAGGHAAPVHARRHGPELVRRAGGHLRAHRDHRDPRDRLAADLRRRPDVGPADRVLPALGPGGRPAPVHRWTVGGLAGPDGLAHSAGGELERRGRGPSRPDRMPGRRAGLRGRPLARRW